ncbi:MAG TPA: hypothetical protein VFB14_07365 [Bryobacteraceae bacterium]|nr:hypothetical protein [Bryobacteraceae bacterium]
MKSFSFVLLALCTGMAFAQQTNTGVPLDTGVPAGIVNNPIQSIFGGFVERNSVSFFGFADGLYDHVSGRPGAGADNSAGALVGGGADIAHLLKNGSLALAYRGDYRGYTAGGILPSGSDQNLSLIFNKRFTRRWSMWNSESIGRYTYGGGGYYGLQTSTTNAVVTNPFSNSDTFVSAGLGATYQQTARLSYQVGVNFFLTRYGFPGAFGTTGGSAFVGANYRLSARTSFGGTLSYADYIYQHNAGKSRMESAFLTLTHLFTPHWQGSVSGGVTRSFAAGTLVLPVSFIDPNTGQTITGYVTGPYNNVSTVPYFQANISHMLRTSSFSAGAGENVIPGNGFFLAQRDIFVNGNYSRRVARSMLTTTLSYNHLSTASTQSGNYTSTALIVSYGYSLGRHIGTSFHYMYLHYGSVGTYAGFNENEIGAGLTFNSKNVPITPY